MSALRSGAAATAAVGSTGDRPVGMEALENGGDSPVEIGPLNDTVGFLLRLAQVRLFGGFYERFGERGLKPGQYSALLTIGLNPGIRQGVLARALMIKRANMAKMIGALAREGFVHRSVPADDMRAIELRLTQKGRALVDEVLPELIEHDRSSTAMLARSDRETLLRLLRKIVRPHGEPQSAADPGSGGRPC